MREMTVSVPIATVPHCAYQHPYNLLWFAAGGYFPYQLMGDTLSATATYR
jgi:hypothetical protein